MEDLEIIRNKGVQENVLKNKIKDRMENGEATLKIISENKFQNYVLNKQKLKSKFGTRDDIKINNEKIEHNDNLKNKYNDLDPDIDIIIKNNRITTDDVNFNKLSLSKTISDNDLNFYKSNSIEIKKNLDVNKIDFMTDNLKNYKTNGEEHKMMEYLSTNTKYDFDNIFSMIEKKINNSKNNNKSFKKIIGDVTDVPNIIVNNVVLFGINKKKLNIREALNDNNSTDKKIKCNTVREEIPKNLENLKNLDEINNKNDALTMKTEDLIKKSDSNEFEMNGNQLIPIDKLRRKTSKDESYIEFVNNNKLCSLNLNDEKTNNNTYPEDMITSKNMSSEGYYKIDTRVNSKLHLPENFWTRDVDKKIFVDLLNENVTEKWDRIKEDKMIRIYKKKMDNNPSILLKTMATINGFTKDDIFNAIADVRIRKEWDKLFSEFKIVEENKEEGSEVLYMSLKSPFLLVDARDFVQKRKIWSDFPDKNSICIHFKSIDHPLCPNYRKTVRAHTYISGYFIRSESDNPPVCSLHILSQTDIRGSIPTWIVNKLSQTAPNDWVNNLIKGCKMYRNKNGKV